MTEELPNIEQAPEAPKKRGRPKGSRNKRGRKRNLESQIAGVLSTFNLAFMLAPPQYQGDALDMVEIGTLAKALNEAAKENATLYSWLDAALGGTGSAILTLVAVGAAIGARRVARHGMFGIGQEWDEHIGMYLNMQNGGDVPNVVDFTELFAQAQASDDAEATG